MNRRSVLFALMALGAGGAAFIATKPSILSLKDSASSNRATKADIKHSTYIELGNPLPFDKGTVTEFYWLGCPHCFNLEVPLKMWLEKTKGKVKFIRNAAPISSNWIDDARFVYAGQELNIYETIHERAFHFVQEGKLNTSSDESIKRFFKGTGIDAEKFLEIMKSDSVSAKQQEVFDSMTQANITGVPVLVVNGKYIPRMDLRGMTYDKYFEIVEDLLTKP